MDPYGVCLNVFIVFHSKFIIPEMIKSLINQYMLQIGGTIINQR